ncbi:hypothetical protein [Hydrogenimonas sp. SS33]|uniref:ABC transporter permease n=1 Tax=Hydrogenimonas leucolamina TaxID=2954236 RepID=UPI00336C0FAB
MRRGLSPLKAIILLLSLLWLAAAFLPLLWLTASSLFGDDVAAFLKSDATPRTMQLLAHSLWLALAVTVTSAAGGVGLALLLQKSRLLFRRFWLWLFVVPLLVPPYLWALGWADLLSPEGPLARWLPSSSLEPLRAWFSGFGGSWFVLSVVFLPIPMVVTALFLRSVPAALEEAGLLATGWRGVLGGITLPLVWPGILLSAVVVFLLVLGEPTVPQFFRYNVFITEILTRFAAFYDIRSATLLSLPLVLLAALLLFLEYRGGRSHTPLALTFEGRETLPVPLRHPLLLEVALGGFALLTVGLPLAGLLAQAASMRVGELYAHAADALGNSLFYAFWGATLLTLFGFFIGYGVQRRLCGAGRVTEALSLFLFALPGSVVAISMILFYNRPSFAWLYGTAALVIVAYLAKYLLLPSRITALQMAAIPPSMEEAARLAGASWRLRLVAIVVPLAKRGIAVGWLSAFLFILRDTDVTMLLYPPGGDTLSVRLLTLMANGAPSLIAGVALLQIAVTALPAAFLSLLFRGEGR